MVAANPLFTGAWTLKKFRATVINDIWPEVLFFTLIATMVSLVSSLTPHSLAMSNQMLTVLGTVLGLVISFRTSSAYERYSEGRKLWTSIVLTSRNIASIIWIHVPFDRIEQGTQRKMPILHAVIEKKSMVNLVQAFSVSVKHFLRGEPGIYYADLYPLICFLPKYASHPHGTPSDEDMLPLWKASQLEHDGSAPPPSPKDGSPVTTQRAMSPQRMEEDELNNVPDSKRSSSWSLRGRPKLTKRFDPEKALPEVHSDYALRPARNPPPESLYDYLPFLRIFKIVLHPFKQIWKKQTEPPMPSAGRSFTGKKLNPEAIDSNVPLEITLFLSSYLAWLTRKGMLQPALASAMTTGIAAMQDTVANLERIRNTPLPFAYQAHLRMSLWIYLFFLPFQIFDAFHYLTIPATAFASFLLIGFLEIGQEIENPFNYDANDLDLDHFCLSIQRELHEITAHSAPEPDAYVFTTQNQPFAPGDRRNAKDMMHDVSHAYHGPETGMHSIRRTLLKSWKDVDEVTRH